MRFILICITCIFLTTAAIAETEPATAGTAADNAKKVYDQHEWPKAIAALKPLAEAGDADALFMLGNIYNDGNGVIKNHVQAIDYYRRAAEKGKTDAMISIAALYQAGLGVEKNAKVAAAWFERAAMLGDPVGSFFYAIMLFQGDLTRKTDFVQNQSAAYKWFRITARTDRNDRFKTAGEKMAQMVVGRLTSAQKQLADAEALGWNPAELKDLGALPDTPLPIKPAPDKK